MNKQYGIWSIIGDDVPPEYKEGWWRFDGYWQREGDCVLFYDINSAYRWREDRARLYPENTYSVKEIGDE